MQQKVNWESFYTTVTKPTFQLSDGMECQAFSMKEEREEETTGADGMIRNRQPIRQTGAQGVNTNRINNNNNSELHGVTRQEYTE